MTRFGLMAGIAAVVVTAGASAAELPTFEVTGFPISQHQVAVMGSANVEEQSPVPTLTLAGMPASPTQIAILTPRSTVLQATAERPTPTTVGLTVKP
ncbi:hypothetical protein [Bradyrhizobium sp. CCGUVB23]|uniref:hypothetical protein n=1 Tax=Bradyrhizobium sp. CCGUVB23 TaxID=2949630 RepID=UPI0020B303AD|nr:hypothetical protein [Bradyrhizobium sp. CCGUVB23]MCP3462642.1 hypothetical protein [Bradyrhizobium sp. CCGUVB23]